VAEVRPVPRGEVYLWTERLIGEQAQVDWAHVGSLAVTGGLRPLWVFVMVLAYSRAMWAELVFDLTVESLRRSLVRAARFFEGVTRQWLFDNPKTVVLARHGDALRYHQLGPQVVTYRTARDRRWARGSQGSASPWDRLWASYPRYDRAGRVQAVDDARWGTTTYAYDDLDRLTLAARGRGREAFAYDPAGDIVGVLRELDERSLAGKVGEKVELAPGNLVLRKGETTYSYDKRGRRVRAVGSSPSDDPRATEYEWDARERLRKATLPDGTVANFGYDAIGRRVRKEVVHAGAQSRPDVTEYVWDGPALGMEFGSSEGVRTFVHMPGTFLPLLHQERGEVFTYVVDRMGVPKELLSADGLVAWSAAHGAWGDVVAEDADPAARARYGGTIRSPFRLLGQIADPELGLCFTRHRLFDPVLGRWLSPDPLGIGGGTNAYAFDGAPSIVADPWGLNTDGTGGGSGHDEKWHADRLAAARAARDAKAAELGQLKPPERPAIVTAGYNKETGEVAVGVSQGQGRGCAEPEVVKQLGGDPSNVQMTEPVRPRAKDPPFEQRPVCPSCEGKYGRGAFPPGTQYESDKEN